MVDIRAFEETAEGWETLARTQSAYFDTFPISAERARFRRLMMPEGRFWTGLVASRNGQDLGTALVFDATYLSEPNQMFVMCAVMPEEIGRDLERRLFDAMLEMARSRAPDGIHAEVESRRPDQIGYLEAAGFLRKSTLVYSEIDLTRDAPTAVEPPDDGLRILSVTEWSEIEPNWKEGYIEAVNRAMTGMPAYIEQAPITVEMLDKLLVAPGFELGFRFVALDPIGRCVGITGLNRNPIDPTRFGTASTGVSPEARRRGIGLRLKAHAIARVRAAGGRVIGTENEETNPMLALNLRLGFQRRFDIYMYAWKRA